MYEKDIENAIINLYKNGAISEEVKDELVEKLDNALMMAYDDGFEDGMEDARMIAEDMAEDMKDKKESVEDQDTPEKKAMREADRSTQVCDCKTGFPVN